MTLFQLERTAEPFEVEAGHGESYRYVPIAAPRSWPAEDTGVIFSAAEILEKLCQITAGIGYLIASEGLSLRTMML